MLGCFVVDDEPMAVKKMCDYIDKTPGFRVIGSSTDPVIAALEIQRLKPDVIFSDIEMPELSGLELARITGQMPFVIFVTGHPDHALSAFHQNAFAYLLKPVSYSRFLETVQRINQFSINNDQVASDTLFIKSGGKGRIESIRISEILYLESNENYTTVVTVNDRIEAYMKISEMTDLLPAQSFTRVHRSFIIQHSFVKSIMLQSVILKDETHIPLGESYKSAFMEKIKPLLVVSTRTKQ